jgi:hypothetical protein
MRNLCLGVIGSAGRQQPIEPLHWKRMREGAEALLGSLADEGRIVSALVSGGAAGADQMAVRLFLDPAAGRGLALQLELAAEWDRNKTQYVETQGRDWLTNPGRTLNRHHRNFQVSSGEASLEDLEAALRRGDCEWRVDAGGLLGRNRRIAERADVLLAMTFGLGREVAQGGTADTCRKYLRLGKTEIYHLDLNSGELFSEADVPVARS